MKKSLVLLVALFTAGLLSAQRLGVQGGYSLSTPFIGTEDNAVDFNARSVLVYIGALLGCVTNRWGFGRPYSICVLRISIGVQVGYYDHIQPYVLAFLYIYCSFGKKPAFPSFAPSFVGLHGKDIAWLNIPTKSPSVSKKMCLAKKTPATFRFVG